MDFTSIKATAAQVVIATPSVAAIGVAVTKTDIQWWLAFCGIGFIILQAVVLLIRLWLDLKRK